MPARRKRGRHSNIRVDQRPDPVAYERSCTGWLALANDAVVALKRYRDDLDNEGAKSLRTCELALDPLQLVGPWLRRGGRTALSAEVRGAGQSRRPDYGRARDQEHRADKVKVGRRRESPLVSIETEREREGNRSRNRDPE
jgi:hypothetical protein